MKNNFLTKKGKLSRIIATFVLLLFIVFYACQDEFRDSFWNQEDARAIEYAQVWYEGNKPAELSLRSSNGKEKVPMKPEWKNAFTKKNEKYEVVETDLTTWGMFSFTAPENMEKYMETKDARYKQSYTRIVFRTDRETNETVGFLMTFVPNVEWLEKSRFKPFMEGNYIKRGKNFGGWILFHNMDGSFSNGWVYENGKITGSVEYVDTDQVELSLRSGMCTIIDWYLNIWNCPYWYTGSEAGYSTYCSLQSSTYIGTTVLYCSGGGGGGYGGGGGGDGGASAALSALARNISLDTQQTQKLNQILQDWLKDCVFKVLNKYVTDRAVQFNDIRINSALSSPAGYDVANGHLLYRSGDDVYKEVYFLAEFTHLFQEAYYGNSQMRNYHNTARGNIEFEAQLITDLMCETRTGFCGFTGAGLNHSADYSRWLYQLVYDAPQSTKALFPTMWDIMNTKWNGLGYQDFLNDFAAKSGLTVNQSLYPGALEQINRVEVNNCLTQY
jgi:hypothetical protein